MSDPNQPYPPTDIPQPQQRKSNKKLWIILSIVIGVFVIGLGGCVACVAIVGSINTSKPPRPRVQNITARLDEGIIWHDVYFTNTGLYDLHEVNISISLIGEKGERKAENRYYAVWSADQEQKVSFEAQNSPFNVQKISITGSCKEGDISLFWTPKE